MITCTLCFGALRGCKIRFCRSVEGQRGSMHGVFLGICPDCGGLVVSLSDAVSLSELIVCLFLLAVFSLQYGWVAGVCLNI